VPFACGAVTIGASLAVVNHPVPRGGERIAFMLQAAQPAIVGRIFRDFR